MEQERLRGEVAVVTGSDSGIGQATAVEFAKEGADVVVTYLEDRVGAEHTCEAVAATGRHVILVQLDQRDPQSVAHLFEETRNRLGTPTVLVNNAAIDASGRFVADVTLDQWDNEIKTNLYGPFYCCREFIRGLGNSGKHGTIINITSVHEEIPRAGAAGYDASKGGLRNLTRTLALELADKNINVNNIAPGMVLTPMNQEAVENAQAREQQVQSIPMKRAAEPEEIAKAAVFLASADARYIHGVSLVVDGGLMQSQGQGA
jgi:glucose 1-dehydrogenase